MRWAWAVGLVFLRCLAGTNDMLVSWDEVGEADNGLGINVWIHFFRVRVELCIDSISSHTV